MIEKALSAGEDHKAADYIEQAAKEMGGGLHGTSGERDHSGGGPAGGREQAAAKAVLSRRTRTPAAPKHFSR